jgi:putative FmdB family regulatory protein
MPWYSYFCQLHGEFEIKIPFKMYQSVYTCPSCGTECERVITPPNIAKSDRLFKAISSARDRAEESRSTPKLITDTPKLPTTAHAHNRLSTDQTQRWKHLPRP